MLDFNNLVIPNDLSKFTKNDLRDLATELNVASTINNKVDLAIAVYDKFNKNETHNNKVKDIINNKLLAGKTAVKWFELDENLKYDEIVKKLTYMNNNLFDNISIPKIEDLSTEPTIFGMVSNDASKEIYIRLIYKSGVKSDMYGTNINKTPIPAYATIYINFNEKILEYRGDAKKAKKTVNIFIDNINNTTMPIVINEKFEFTVEEVADKLQGELIDTVSLPDINIVDDNDKFSNVSKVLDAIDDYFKDTNIDNLEGALYDVNELFDNNIDENIMPFSSLLLSGLETVGLGSNKELRNTPLFKYLKTNLTQTTGFIKIKVTEGNVINEYTIRVGIQTKSIFFTSDVSEHVINYVRDILFK
ncbi:hypothetical protein [Staphylococcus succinus]|uniref:hypothetical protein n=1 Tax=Staphylococcus succinus TaxID=61015 RepID=UPI000935A477|nr:hypothetical protein [Staphylococcus succinus]